jgi:hypothetical protein
MKWNHNFVSGEDRGYRYHPDTGKVKFLVPNRDPGNIFQMSITYVIQL